MTTSPLVLTYSHNVIEHLGLKLYQNKPTSVIAELVSNAWDANAPNVWVTAKMGEASSRFVAVHDDGHGMTHDELAKSFLVIGAAKRASPTEKSRGNYRKLMGRKGIGKLAPFGIANTIEVCSVSADTSGRCVWIRLELDAIKQASTPGATATYSPIVICDGPSPSTETFKKEDPTGEVKNHIDRVGAGTGTLVLLRDLTLQRALSDRSLIESLGRRLSATLGGDFSVHINGALIKVDEVFPDFEFRIPEQGVSTETVDGHEVRFWVGFVKSASWSADEAGVGVYAHGKICQERPFTFGAKGKEIFTRYMFAVVEADWLDELPDDLISTDRSSTNWDAEALKPLRDWGKSRVSQWVGKFESWREKEEEKANRKLVKKLVDDNQAPDLSEHEQEKVAELLTRITPGLGKDADDSKELLAKSISSAWIQEPMRELVRQLWTEFGKEGKSVPQVFSGLVAKLVAYSVPESLNLALVFAQRAFALTKLYDYVHNGQEVDLQRLLQEFPWIIEPDSVFLTANQPLKKVVESAEEAGQIPQPKKSVVAGTPDANKPDFVFLSSPDQEDIVVVELKNPQVDLTIENREQLYSYMTFLEAHYPDARLRGYLIGRAPKGLKMNREGSRVVLWTDVLKRARSRYVTFLAAMLASVPEDTVKLDTLQEFAGPEVWDLLKKLATKNPKLTTLIGRYGDKKA